MPIRKDITTTQFYKIFILMKKHKEMTVQQISDQTGFPIQSVRRILSNLDKAGKLQKKYIYRLK